MTIKKPPPFKVLAFIICDTVIDDKITNKKSLVGLFNGIIAKTFPCAHPILHVFVSLTEGHGAYQCSLSCVKDDESKKILSLSGSLEFNNPLHVVEVNFEIRGIVFPEAGIYRFDLLCDDIPIISRKFQVAERGVQ